MLQPDLSEILETAQRPRMIAGLRMEEVSGVDHPANDVEGWSVMKARKLSRGIGLEHKLVDADYAVVAKSVSKEQKYTFGVLYKASHPGDLELDLHGEYIKAEDLQKAQWGYVDTGDHRIYLQHGSHGIVPVGKYVDIVTWPHAVDEEFTLPNGKTQKATIPAGSLWMGVIWNSIGWPLVKSGQLRGLSLGGFRRRKQAEETVMATPDSLEGYQYEGVKKAHFGLPGEVTDQPRTNTGPADQPIGAPVAPVEKPPAQFTKPQIKPPVTDHKKRLDRRFKEFLAGLEATLTAANYTKMLTIIADFNDRAMSVTDQAGHIVNLKQLAADLKKIMPSEADVVQILRMGKFVAAERLTSLHESRTEEEQKRDAYSQAHGLGNSIERMVRRGLNQGSVLNEFTGEEPDPIGLEAAKRKKQKGN